MHTSTVLQVKSSPSLNTQESDPSSFRKRYQTSSLLLVLLVVLFTGLPLLGHCDTPQPTLTINIPMRDGFELPTSLYFPDNKQASCPCILIRHPLGKDRVDPAWLELTKEDYVIAVQATRSSCDVTGACLPYLTDGWGELKDGYDTVEFLAHSEYTNGKVGTLGTSATGITQLMMAPAAPPSLSCQYITMAAPSLYEYAVYPGGQFRKNQVEGWLQLHSSAPAVINLLKKETAYSPLWQKFNALEEANKIKAPQLHVGGWYDIFLQGTIDAFVTAQSQAMESSKKGQRLIIGPWSHYWPKTDDLGDFKVPDSGRAPPMEVPYKLWFDHYLKGEKNGLEKIPLIQYYVMGPLDGTPSSGNIWKSTAVWPPKAETEKLYLEPENFLSFSSSKDSRQFPVLFDPLNPVPTIGGRNLFLPAGPKDQRPIEARKDVLVFTSKPLEQDLEVTGRLKAHVYITKAAVARDIVIRLCDVYPDGRSILVAEGIAHVPAETGQIQEPCLVDVDLWSTSMVFAKSHQIRVSVSGSNFPSFDVSFEQVKDQPDNNLCFTVHTGGKTASCLDLPVIKTIKAETSETPVALKALDEDK